MWFWWKPGDSVMVVLARNWREIPSDSVMVVPARNWRWIPSDSVVCGAGPELEVEVRRLVVWSDS